MCRSASLGTGRCRTIRQHDLGERESMKFSEILKWFRRQQKPPKYFDNVRIVDRMSEVPEQPARDCFIVRRDGRDIWAVFQCPCDRRHLLQINLSRQRRPVWKCRMRKGEISLTPSVWLDYGCKSHFWIHESRIYWATEGTDRDS